MSTFEGDSGSAASAVEQLSSQVSGKKRRIMAPEAIVEAMDRRDKFWEASRHYHSALFDSGLIDEQGRILAKLGETLNSYGDLQELIDHSVEKHAKRSAEASKKRRTDNE